MEPDKKSRQMPGKIKAAGFTKSGKYTSERIILMRRIRDWILRDSMIYTVVLLIVLAGGYILGHTVLWYGTELLYPLLHWVSENAVVTGIMLWIMGIFVIMVRYLYYLTGLIGTMTQSMEQILHDDQEQIVLPEELSQVQLEMNDIKQKIQISRQQAREAEQRKNDLVVYLAHDLKTPLTSVMGYLMLLQEEPDISGKLQQKYLDIVVRKAQRLEDLINEFFEITRFNLTTMELEKSSVDFTRLLEQTIFEFQPMMQQKQLTCRLDAPSDLLLTCDVDKIQRVVDNLLRNGILYGYEGTQLEVVVREELMRREGIMQPVVILTCTNHGPTIPKEKLGRIFEQFYRLDSARTSSTGGAGLGLAIAREIVRLHGGKISAQSEEEMTTFRVELPRN